MSVTVQTHSYTGNIVNNFSTLFFTGASSKDEISLGEFHFPQRVLEIKGSDAKHHYQLSPTKQKMAITEKQALNRLLMVISREIEEEKFKDLIRLYIVKPQDLEELNQYDTLQYLYDKKVLDLRVLVENLSTVGCPDQSRKVADYINSKEHQDKRETVYSGKELVQAAPEAVEGELHNKPKKRKDGNSVLTFDLSPL